MKLYNFGSLNIDKVYEVQDMVREGETIFSPSLSVFAGGKGLNQSLSAARAGMEVVHAGCIGKDGVFLKELLDQAGADTSLMAMSDKDTGHAIIQVNQKGQNCIIVCAGANGDVSKDYVDGVLAKAQSGDFVLLQNETSNIEYIITKAASSGLKVVWNPSPFPADINSYPLEDVGIFLVNEIEGAALAGVSDRSGDEILDILSEKYPKTTVVLTLGSEGVMCLHEGKKYKHPRFSVKAVDTTAAGDTFTGYFLYCFSQGKDVTTCLKYACAAAGIAVSRKGAAPSIPVLSEVEDFIKANS